MGTHLLETVLAEATAAIARFEILL
jgi:hypothetical protein